MSELQAEASEPSWPVCAVLGVALFGALALWTWGGWGDPVIDWGQQLYVPWQVAEGRALYRDLAWYLGPLSVTVHALAFKLFGPSVRLVVGLNLVVLASLCAAVFGVFALTAGRRAALLAGCLTLTVFGFAQSAEVGNYAFVSPYAHELTHGVALVVLSLAALLARLLRGGARWSALAGACLGAAFMTKPEAFVAGAAALVGGAALGAWIAPLGGRTTLRDGVAAALGAGVPLALVAGLLDAPGDVCGAWRALAEGGRVSQAQFYLAGAGLDRPAANAGLMLLGALLIASGAALALAADAQGRERLQPWVAPGLAFTAAGVHVWDPTLLGRALPLVVLGLLAWLLRRLAAHRGGHTDGRQVACLIGLTAWAVASLGLLAKMGLYARLHHYGFALALPATVFVAVAGVSLVPAWTERGQTLRTVTLYGFLFVAAFSLKSSGAHHARRTVTLGSGADAMRVLGTSADGEQVGQHVAAALDVLRAEVRPEQTVAVLPEGILLNYLARRRAPTRHTKFLLHELAGFGELGALNELEQSRPDVVVLVHRSLHEFGAESVAASAEGKRLLAWVAANYEQTHAFGPEPFGPEDRFGVRVLQRR